MPDRLPQWQQALLERHRLSVAYLEYAQKWFAPLAFALAEHQKSAGRPLLVGVNGCQGSGKTTFCDYLTGELYHRKGVRTVALSLDDFYHTHARRERLAHQVHPLFITRGVPGPHERALLQLTLDALHTPPFDGPVAIPRFDKATDDRYPRERWDLVDEGVDLVLLEGWCLGARPEAEEALATPVNTLESEEDPDGTWRRHVNRALALEFEPLYGRIEQWVMLRAPSFDCVYRWRREQEQKLAAATHAVATNRIMDEAQLARFIQFFQRLTLHCLDKLPEQVDYLYSLDEQRQVTDYRHGGNEGP